MLLSGCGACAFTASSCPTLHIACSCPAGAGRVLTLLIWFPTLKIMLTRREYCTTEDAPRVHGHVENMRCAVARFKEGKSEAMDNVAALRGMGIFRRRSVARVVSWQSGSRTPMGIMLGIGRGGCCGELKKRQNASSIISGGDGQLMRCIRTCEG